MGIRISADTEDMLKRAINQMLVAGFRLSSGPNLIWWADLAPDLTLPHPVSQWWAALMLTEPKTKIYAARDGVQVYKSANSSAPPDFSSKFSVLAKGKDVEVWHAPVPGSEWICIYDAGFALWVLGPQMSPTL